MKRQNSGFMRNRGYLRRILLNAVVFCLIPVLIFIMLLVYQSYSNIVSIQYETACNEAYRTAQRFDDCIDALSENAIRVMTEKKLGLSYLQRQTYNEVEATETLANLALAVPYAGELGIFYDAKPVIYTSKGKYNPSVYAKWVLLSDAKRFLSCLASAQNPGFLNCDMASGTAVFYYPGTMFSTKDNRVGVLFTIPNDSLISFLNLNLSENYQLTAIYDLSGKTLIYDSKYQLPELSGLDFKSYGKEGVQYANQNGSTYFTCTSPSGYRIMTVMQTQLFMRKVKTFRDSVFLIGAIMLVLCALFIILMVWDNYRPVKRLLKSISSEQYTHDTAGNKAASENEFNAISGVIERNVREKEAYRRELEEQWDILAAQLFEKLLDGATLTEQERIALHFEGTNYFVAVASISAFQQVNSIRSLLSPITSKQKQIYILEKSFSGYVVFICTMPESSASERIAWMRGLREKTGVEALMLGVGSASESIDVLYRSYLEATCALEWCSTMEPIICFDNRSQASDAFSHDNIARIGKLALSGNEQLTQKEIDNVFSGVDRLKDSVRIQRRFCIELLSELDRLLSNLQPSKKDQSANNDSIFKQEWYTKILASGNSQDMHDAIRLILRGYCASIRHMTQDYKEMISSEIIDYVNASFTDQDLCLDLLCSRFNVMDYNVSRIFKEKTGSSFRKYLTDLRIEYAKKLLLTTDKCIGDVAILTGFSSANYFARMFKATEGIIPTTFREKACR